MCTLSKEPSPGFSDDGRLAWRIRIYCTDRAGCVPVKFARKLDAERGIAALKRIARLGGTHAEVAKQLTDIGQETIRRTLSEAMAW